MFIAFSFVQVKEEILHSKQKLQTFYVPINTTVPGRSQLCIRKMGTLRWTRIPKNTAPPETADGQHIVWDYSILYLRRLLFCINPYAKPLNSNPELFRNLRTRCDSKRRPWSAPLVMLSAGCVGVSICCDSNSGAWSPWKVGRDIKLLSGHSTASSKARTMNVSLDRLKRVLGVHGK